MLDGNAAGSAFYAHAGFEPDGARAAHEAAGRNQVRWRVELKR